MDGQAYTFNTSAGLSNISNFTVQALAPDGIITEICSNQSNVDNGSLSSWACIGSTNTLEDRFTYTINMSFGNGTGATYSHRNSSLATAVVVDNTVPAGVSLDDIAGTIFNNRKTSITSTATNLSTCKWRFGSNLIIGTINTARTSCSATLSTTNPPDGDYTVTFESSDGTNTTLSTSRTYRVNFVSNAKSGKQTLDLGAAQVAVQKIEDNKVVVFILLAIVIVVIIDRQNKGRR